MNISKQNVPDHTSHPNYDAMKAVLENIASGASDNPEKEAKRALGCEPKEPDYEAWRPVLERFYEVRDDGFKASNPFSGWDIANIRGLMAVMPAEQPATGDEMERAREYAAKTAEHGRGTWQTDLAERAALIAIREEAKRVQS